MIESPQTGLRKAAILVAALDRSIADELLDHMGPEQAQLVRQTILELGPVDPEEERRVVDEFLRLGPMVPRKQPSGIELDEHLAQRLANQAYQADEKPAAQNTDASARPFRYLQQTQCDQIARLLTSERPQTIALVLSHLPQEQAGRVLVLLSPSAQVDVVRRLVDLEETDPVVLREVEHALQSRLAEHVPMQRRRMAGASAVSGILKASESSVGRRILDNLAAHDHRLASQFAPEIHQPPAAPEIGPVAFDDLVDLSDSALSVLADAAGPELLMLALVGAPEAVIERMLASLAPRAARAVRQGLANLVPTRLSDVEAARQRLADVARDLATAGDIELAPRRDLVQMMA